MAHDMRTGAALASGVIVEAATRMGRGRLGAEARGTFGRPGRSLMLVTASRGD